MGNINIEYKYIFSANHFFKKFQSGIKCDSEFEYSYNLTLSDDLPTFTFPEKIRFPEMKVVLSLNEFKDTIITVSDDVILHINSNMINSEKSLFYISNILINYLFLDYPNKNRSIITSYNKFNYLSSLSLASRYPLGKYDFSLAKSYSFDFLEELNNYGVLPLDEDKIYLKDLYNEGIVLRNDYSSLTINATYSGHYKKKNLVNKFLSHLIEYF